MSFPISFSIHRNNRHNGWDNSRPPVIRIPPGATVDVDIVEAANGEITPTSTAEDLIHVDTTKSNPLTGPVYVEGAEPGDVLKVTIVGFKPSGWGYTANYPGYGLLKDQFPDPALHIWTYDPHAMTPAMFADIARVPLRPHAGTIGVALKEPGFHRHHPPRRVGGNMDARDLSVGTGLYLPVEVPGALFSVGDTHAAQGDGEVCGTAIESAMHAILTFDVIKGLSIPSPRYTTPGPVTRHLDAKGYEVTTGVGMDIIECCRAAVSDMIDLLSRRFGLRPIDAYMLCSVCADLRLTSVGGVSNRVVSLLFPRIVIE
jgi:acetamidase/formamidase